MRAARPAGSFFDRRENPSDEHSFFGRKDLLQRLTSFGYHDMNRVSRLFADRRPYLFPDPDDRSGGLHPNQTAVIREAVEPCMYLDSAFAEFFFYIKWKFYVCAVNAGDFPDDSVEFIVSGWGNGAVGIGWADGIRWADGIGWVVGIGWTVRNRWAVRLRAGNIKLLFHRNSPYIWLALLH